MGDYESLAEINVLAGKHFRDERLSMKGIPPKLRKITDAFLESRGIQVKVEPISILDEDFQKEVSKPNPDKDARPLKSNTPSGTTWTLSLMMIPTCRRPSPRR